MSEREVLLALAPALLAAMREAVARGMGHWRVDKLLEAVERSWRERGDE